MSPLEAISALGREGVEPRQDSNAHLPIRMRTADRTKPLDPTRRVPSATTNSTRQSRAH